jgi:hypothetical protein
MCPPTNSARRFCSARGKGRPVTAQFVGARLKSNPQVLYPVKPQQFDFSHILQRAPDPPLTPLESRNP